MKRLSSGFTLIELLIVFSIMGILMGVGISSYAEFNQRQQIVQSAKRIKNQLRSAQGKALSGVKDCRDDACRGTGGTCTSASLLLDGWFVNFGTKFIYATCGSSAVRFGDEPLEVASDIQLTAYRNLVAVTGMGFYPLNKGADETTICVTSTKLGKVYKLMVAPSGDINEYGIVATCP